MRPGEIIDPYISNDQLELYSRARGVHKLTKLCVLLMPARPSPSLLVPVYIMQLYYYAVMLL